MTSLGLPLENPPPRDNSPMGAALEWVGRIMAIGLVMVLPILGGRYLDHWLGTEFLGIVGLVLGVAAGFASLLAITGVWSGRRK